ncbi:MAG: SRPBCC family protein [Verrucomicrobia bacterium]|nr:SRPBCC family protein [Verrucomicrobiota bacterium]NDE63751.1 cell division inhibitor [Chlamydiota bacterium]
MHILTKTTWLPVSLDQAWEFFCSPDNLALITPKDMNFHILDRSGSKEMFAGQIIQYKVSILPFLRLRWVTEITHVENKKFFVDEQRFGPYRFWHHKHFFYPENGGVRMVDIVHYKLPLGFLGRMIEPFLVAPKLEKIFSFREEVIQKIFHK